MFNLPSICEHFKNNPWRLLLALNIYYRFNFPKIKVVVTCFTFLVCFDWVYDVWPCYDVMFGTIVILMLSSFCLLFIDVLVQWYISLIKIYSAHFNTSECETDLNRGFWILLSFAFESVISVVKYCSFCLTFFM